MLKLFSCAIATLVFAANPSISHAGEGVPYSEHGDVTGQENFNPNDIEPAAGDIVEDNSAGIPYSEHGEITE